MNVEIEGDLSYEIGKDPSYEIGNVLVTPTKFRAKVESVRAKVDELAGAVASSRVRLDQRWKASWAGFVMRWGGFLAAHPPERDLASSAIAFGHWNTLVELESELSRHRMAFEEAGGSPPASSINERAAALYQRAGQTNAVLLRVWNRSNQEVQARWLQLLTGLERLYPPLGTTGPTYFTRYWAGTVEVLRSYESAVSNWLIWAQEQEGQQAATMRRRY